MFGVLAGMALQTRPALAQKTIVAESIDRLAQNLAAEYETRRPERTMGTLLALPFFAKARLRQRGLGNAVSTLISQRFSGRATSVILAESHPKREDMSTASGVALGRLAGAKLVLAGRIEEVGEAYHITARLIEVETGSTVAVEFEELPSQAFEEEALAFLSSFSRPFPLSIYVLYNHRSNSNLSLPTKIDIPSPTANQPDNGLLPRPFSLGLFGLGAKFPIWRKVLLDAAILYMLKDPVPVTLLDESSGGHGTAHPNALSTGRAYRATFEWTERLSEAWRWELGAGAVHYRLTGRYLEVETTAPFIKAAVEFQFGGRVALGFSVFHDFFLKEGLYEPNRVPSFSLNGLSFEPSLTIHF